jgi:hypothetical protein
VSGFVVRLVSLVAVACCLTVLAGCPGRANVQCGEDSHCDLGPGGSCTEAPTGNQWCSYPDPSCPSGERFSDLDVGDGLAGQCVGESPIDAGVDAVIDAGVPAFDVAYASEWRFSVPGPVDGYLLVVNTGVTPLSMSTLQLKSIADDHPTAFVRIIATASETSIPPGHAGGFLTPLATTTLVGSGLVSETRADTDSSYLNIEIVNAPEGTYDIHVSLELELDNARISMPITLHMLPGPTIFANPDVGTRKTVFR